MQRAPAQDEPWYRDAVIYQLHVKSFQDGNDDGIGDFAGLLSRMDYLASLGVDALWLLPFYPSPRRDDGYDVEDYFGVSADYGTAEDVRRLIDAAHERGLRVLGDLVLNHTSDRHAWFERARRAPRDSEEHQFYVWSDTDQRYAGTRIIFPDVEKSNWTWDPVAGRYFFHRFYSHQPDLNYDNPRVLEEMLRVLRHWLDQGFDGFRLDAVAYLAEEEGTSNENLPRTHAVLKRLRAEIDAHYPGRVLLAEANQWPEDMKDYFGDDDECHMAFHFPLMPRMYMAVAQEDRFPIVDILAQTPPTPPNSQWATFLRNHDELTLEMVTDAERDYLWQTYAADPRARLNLGIRRRLAPLLQRDRRRIELMTALLLTLPGTPVIYYGDEIGMGDNIHLGDRDGVRTPMQWSIDRNGGFSRADAQRLVLPTLVDPLYGYPTVNVESQERDPHSLLHWVRGMLRMRRRYPGLFGAGAIRFIASRNRKALAFVRERDPVRVLCIANLSRTLQAVELDLAEFEGRIPLDMLGGATLPAVGAAPYLFTLPPYGFFALELVAPEDLPDGPAPAPDGELELQTLVMRGSLGAALRDGLLDALQAEALSRWLQRENWLPAAAGSDRCVVSEMRDIAGHDGGVVAIAIRVGDIALAPLLLTVAWEGEADCATLATHALARVRRGARIGMLVEAARVPAFVRAWAARLRPERSPAPGIEGEASELVSLADAAQAQGIRVGDGVLITLARGPRGVLDAPAELVRYLSQRRSPQSLRLLEVIRAAPDDAHVLGFAQAWRPTRGDAAQWTIDFLHRALHDFRASTPGRRLEPLRGYLPLARLLGSRLARLHRMLAEGFGTRAADAATIDRYEALATDLLARLPDLRERIRSELGLVPAHLATLARRLRVLDRRLRGGTPPDLMRVHGNLALGSIPLGIDDACFIHFAIPPSPLLADDGVSASRLVDLAALVHGFSRAVALLRHLGGDGDDVPAEFMRGFIDLARRSAVRRYQRVWDPASDGRLTQQDKDWLELLTIHHAIRELEAAPQRGALAVAYQALAR